MSFQTIYLMKFFVADNTFEIGFFPAFQWQVTGEISFVLVAAGTVGTLERMRQVQMPVTFILQVDKRSILVEHAKIR